MSVGKDFVPGWSEDQINSHIGERFGRLVIVEFDHRTDTPNKDGRHTLRYYYKCKCDCGNMCVKPYHVMKRGESQSCGCLQKQRASEAMYNRFYKPNSTGKMSYEAILSRIGEKHHYWTIVNFDHEEPHIHNGAKKGNYYFYKVRCICGNEKVLRYDHIKEGKPISCGCMSDNSKRKENGKKISEYMKSLDPKDRPSYKHGESTTRIYRVWQKICDRVLNPNNEFAKYYHDKGIDPEWADKETGYETFRDWSYANGYVPDDYSVKLYRIDTSKGYYPENCVWMKKHGMNDTKIYRIWKNMMLKCFDKNSRQWQTCGQLGVGVYAEWKDHQLGATNFIKWAYESGYEEGLHLRRYGDTGDYCPENCYWYEKAETNHLSQEALKRIGDAHRIHGMRDTRIYMIWKGMKNRCNNVNAASYPNYGGRGIKVCEEWSLSTGKDKGVGFSNFLKWALENGYQDDLTINRKDNSKGYCPENCEWATIEEQNNNTSSVKYVGFKDPNGNILCFSVAKWAVITGLSVATIQYRLNSNLWSVYDTLTTPNQANPDRSRIQIDASKHMHVNHPEYYNISIHD